MLTLRYGATFLVDVLERPFCNRWAWLSLAFGLGISVAPHDMLGTMFHLRRRARMRALGDGGTFHKYSMAAGKIRGEGCVCLR